MYAFLSVPLCVRISYIRIFLASLEFEIITPLALLGHSSGFNHILFLTCIYKQHTCGTYFPHDPHNFLALFFSLCLTFGFVTLFCLCLCSSICLFVSLALSPSLLIIDYHLCRNRPGILYVSIVVSLSPSMCSVFCHIFRYFFDFDTYKPFTISTFPIRLYYRVSFLTQIQCCSIISFSIRPSTFSLIAFLGHTHPSTHSYIHRGELL